MVSTERSRLREQAQTEAAATEDPFAAADTSLAAAKAQLPHYLATASEDSEDDEGFTPTVPVRRVAHDDEAGTSGAGAPRHDLRPPTPPPVTVAQVAVPGTLAQILQTLTEQQCAFVEQQDRHAEIEARILAEQARQQEAQMLMFQEMRQQQEAVRLQLFQQQ